MRGSKFVARAIFLAFSIMPIAAHSAESNKFVTKQDTVSLVAQSDSVAGNSIRLGLLFRLEKGWHIYWKIAGDAGEPPRLTLTAPEHAFAGAFEWPAVAGVDLHAIVHWLVCDSTICVPQQAAFKLHENAGIETPSAQSSLFAAANAALPRPSPFKAYIAADGVLVVEGGGLGAADIKAVHFFPDNPDAIVNAAPQPLEFRLNGFSLALRPAKSNGRQLLSGVLEITDGNGAMRALTIEARNAPCAPYRN
jgi:thiol:disulfide interchange protein DsbD